MHTLDVYQLGHLCCTSRDFIRCSHKTQRITVVGDKIAGVNVNLLQLLCNFDASRPPPVDEPETDSPVLSPALAQLQPTVGSFVSDAHVVRW